MNTSDNVYIMYKNMTKPELYHKSKNMVKKLYEEFKINYNDDRNKKFLSILLYLDNSKNEYFRKLFLLSLYCNYLHKNKYKIKNEMKDLTLVSECYKKYNFVILDTNEKHVKIIEDIATYFNTDATNLEPITGKILYDLNKINFILKK